MGWEKREREKGSPNYSCRSSSLYTSLQIRHNNSSSMLLVVWHLSWSKMNTITEPNFYQLLLSIIFMNACFIADTENTLSCTTEPQVSLRDFLRLPTNCMHIALLAGSPLSSRQHTFFPSPAIRNPKMPCWAKTYTEALPTWLRVCLTVQPRWTQPLWKYCQSKTHLTLLSLRSKYTLLSIALLQFYSHVLWLVCRTSSLRVYHHSHSSHSSTFIFWTPPSLLVMHFLMWLSLPGITTFYQVYCRFLCTAAILNTHQMCIPFQSKDHFSETGMQWCKQTDSWLKWLRCQN